MTHTPQEKLAAPKFGDWFRGVHASESNPQRDGMYVRTIRRSGRFNAGTFYELTDGKGNFWQYPVGSTIPLSEHGGGGEAVDKNALADHIADALRKLAPNTYGHAFLHRDLRSVVGAMKQLHTTPPTPSAPVVDELQQLAMQADAAASSHDERHMAITLGAISERLLARAALSGVSAPVGVEAVLSTVDRLLSNAYGAGLNDDEFDMLAARKMVLAALTPPAAAPRVEELTNCRVPHYKHDPCHNCDDPAASEDGLPERLEAEAARKESAWTDRPVLSPPTRFKHPLSLRTLLNEAATTIRRLAASGQGELACEGCGKLYRNFALDVVLPDDQWHAIQGRDGGVLCAACIVERGSKLPGVTVAKLHFPDLATPAASEDGAPEEEMELAVAFDFADNPRPYHSMLCPADTNGELYRALKVLAAEARRLAASGQGVEDTKRLDWLEREAADLRPVAYPIADTGDADVVWEVITYHMDYPKLRRIGSGETPREAIDAAMQGAAAPTQENPHG